VNTIASKCRRATMPGRRRSVMAARQFAEANATPGSSSPPSAAGGSGMKSRRWAQCSRACRRQASTEPSLVVDTSSSLPASSNITARSLRKNRCTSTS
jgi:hypothetical protein